MAKRTDRIIVRHNFREYSMAREEGDLATPLLKLAGLVAVALLLAGGYSIAYHSECYPGFKQPAD